MTRPIRRAALALLTLALFATGCAGPGSGSAGSDRLRIAVEQDFGPLNFLTMSEDQLLFLVYDRLVAPSPYAADPEPWLATEVRQVDPLTWEVSLRNDVAWHDGRPFTARDVAFTIDWMKTVKSGTYTHHVTTVPGIQRVDVLGEHQVRLNCAFACPFLGSVTLAHLPMLPEHVWSTVAEPSKYTELPVGTGPYRLTSYQPGQAYRFEANPTYFAGQPRVRELVMPIIPNPSTTFTALRTGEIDVAMGEVPPELVAQFEGSDDITLVRTTPLQYPEVRMNHQRVPFDRAEFRRALSLAVDRQQLHDTVWLGRGRPAVKGYPHPRSPWTNPNLSTPYDPEAARRVLDELGFRDADGDGVREGPTGPLSFVLHVDGAVPIRVRAAQLVAEQLGEVGIGARAEPLDTGSLVSLTETDDFDMYVNQITAHGVADPTQFIMSHYSGYLWELPTQPYPQMERVIEEWKAAQTIDTRKAVAFRMQELFNAQPTSIPLHYPEGILAYRTQAYDGWVESPGYGIVHKWSLLPRAVADQANAVIATPPVVPG